jgi:hypothetical protein
MAAPKVGIHEVTRQRLHKDSAASPHKVKVDPFADKDVATEQQLVVQRTWRYRPAGEPQKTHSPVQPFRVQLLLNQLEGRCAMRRVQVVVDAICGWELVAEHHFGPCVVFRLAAFVRPEQGAACEGRRLDHGEHQWFECMLSEGQLTVTVS